MPIRRLLVVSYAYPPMPSVGANRWDAMVRHLRELGHHVTVVSTSAFGELPDPAAEHHVRRASDLIAFPSLRRLLRRGALPPPSHAVAAESAAAAQSAPLPATLERIFVPDLYLATWVPQATALVRRIVRSEPVDCVITSSPYESTHLIGLLARRRGPAWIADFRDGWCFEPHRPPFPTRLQSSVDRRLEASVVRAADLVVAATQGIADDFESRFELDAACVPNGYDPLRYVALPPVKLPEMPSDAIVLAHTGKLSGIRGRDPRPLFAALRLIESEQPELAGRLRLVLAGHMDSEDARLVADSGLNGTVLPIGQLSHAESVSLQRHADILVLLTSVGSNVVTGKLCEYLSANRPVLVLGDEMEAGKIVRETSTGVAVPKDDERAIADAIGLLTQKQSSFSYSPHGIERYVYPGPAESVAALVEDAIGRRART